MLRVSLLVILLLPLYGCELLQPRSSAAHKAPESANKAAPKTVPGNASSSTSGSSAVVASDTVVQEHLQFIDMLNNSSADSILAIHARTQAAHKRKSSIKNSLRLAWIWATPGHQQSNPWAARKALKTILRKHRLKLSIARLVQIRLMDLERQLDLQQRLSEADAKIRALTTLEHSMEERNAEVQEE